jgi:protoheme IX farnesyltransferase
MQEIKRKISFFAGITALLTFLVIILGGATRVFDAGMSCPDWPTCYGKWIPFPVDISTGYTNFQVFLEWSHRLFASSVGLFLLVALFYAFKIRKKDKLVFWVSIVSFILIGCQVLLGGLTVLLSNIHWSVALHLGIAMIFFGSVVALRRISAQTTRKALAVSTKWKVLLWVFSGFVFCTMILGAMVSTSFAGGSCGGLFSCMGDWLPREDFQQLLHMKHRYMAFATLVLGVLLFILSKKEPATIYKTAKGLKILVTLQVVIGIIVLYSFSHYADVYYYLSVFHLGWGSLLFMACVGALVKVYTGEEGNFHKTHSSGFIRDIIQLMKPRIIVLLVITCAGAMLVATKGNIDLLSAQTFIWTCIGLSLSAGGANMINMWYDHDIDKVMQRTKDRPIPAGRLSRNTSLYWGIFLGIFSTALLWLLVNDVAALMALSGYLFYVFIYTMLLKRRTAQNIVIGGAAGAFPPLVGWAAVQGNVFDLVPWLMFAVIFFWTPPHFWALALKKCQDYTKVGIPMLPVVKGDTETKLQIVYYMLVLLPVVLAFGLFAPFGFIYLTSAVILSAIWLYKAIRLMYAEDNELAMDVFMFSLYYLALLFLAMVVDTFV